MVHLNKYKLEICPQQRTRNRVAIPFSRATVKTRRTSLQNLSATCTEILTQATHLNHLRQF